ncbi:glycosyltransferase family 2 protein [Motilimonas eburnea]|uniref:glycosyltransferase family 2 protein n=1 Tax=Motilimonas eburnea TaxID=1737488 RepID=UPI001E3F4968|nr:glycosyltransferase [Motilimonas eburnea]MCE2573332.1 glycosyltransferase [Motilimonas eburnea]
MLDTFNALWGFLSQIWLSAFIDGQRTAFLLPAFIFLELSLLLVVVFGVLNWYRHRQAFLRAPSTYSPRVSVIITCYGEGRDIEKTILSFAEQIYAGHIEIIAVIDGAKQNLHTYQAAMGCRRWFIQANRNQIRRYPNRSYRVLPKWQRGGRVSTLNAGLHVSRGDIIMNADGDTSFDNQTVALMVKHFQDPNVPAVAGALKVRNQGESWVTRLQTLEYMMSIQCAKTGLARWNMVNNISGAFGAFRCDFLRKIGGWNTHTAEDLDLTMRIKAYFGRHPHLYIPFEPHAIGFTDVPDTFKSFRQQRLRWDGDLLFLYLRKHKQSFRLRLLGLKNFLFTVIYGVLQEVILPFLIFLFTIWLFVIYPAAYVWGVLLFVYFLYLGQAMLLLALYYFLISERREQELWIFLWSPVYPLFAFFRKIWSMIAALYELLARGHEETSMAPWWVIKRGNKF